MRHHRHRRATRNVSHISSPRLRLPNVYNLQAYRSARRGLQYNPYKRRSLWHVPFLFHDATRLVDPLEDLRRSTDVRYRPLYDSGSEGQTDHRFFYPDTSSIQRDSLKSIARYPAQVEVSKQSKPRKRVIIAPPSPMVVPSKDKDGAYLQFNLPRQVAVCVRRHQRREVLFALGKGGGRTKPPVWKEESYIRC